MKKYLSIVALLTILFSSIYYLYYFDGSLYLPKGLLKENTRTNFVVKGDTVLHKPTNKPFVVKGVDVESSLAVIITTIFLLLKKRIVNGSI